MTVNLEDKDLPNNKTHKSNGFCGSQCESPSPTTNLFMNRPSLESDEEITFKSDFPSSPDSLKKTMKRRRRSFLSVTSGFTITPTLSRRMTSTKYIDAVR
jgi:hypothetical protein